jgi:CMP-N,N'-diacetyllegionaminic acid synthase
MLIYVDIDQTICNQPTRTLDYRLAIPMMDRIEGINKLYDSGHTIVYWTARGTVTKVDWREVTEEQFKIWGVKYHGLIFGKPAYDLLIDDKAINAIEDFGRISEYM